MFLCFGPKACEILAPQPGIKPVPTPLEIQSLNPWTTGKVRKDDDFHDKHL